MLITLTIISILIITLVAWFANQVLPFVICPICAGVFLTWVGLVGAHFVGYGIDLVIPALLMGGSVVGIAYQLEKKSHNLSAGALLLWKVFFMPAGFVVAYGVLNQWWAVSGIAMTALVLVSFLFLSAGRTARMHQATTNEVEKRLKDCC